MHAAAPADALELSKERFGFTAFLSLCLHAILILGVGFTFSTAPEVTTLDITLATEVSSSRSSAPPEPIESADTPTPADVADNVAEQTPEQRLAELRAQLELHREDYAQRPRRYTLTSIAPKDEADTAYLNQWRERIEDMGNRHYPAEATAAGIYGTLRLLVAINPDGSVADVRILRSSGEPVLDAAALRIVELSAPFTPLPTELRQRADVLEIIRTWQFQRGGTFSSF
jgi:protein TonB